MPQIPRRAKAGAVAAYWLAMGLGARQTDLQNQTRSLMFKRLSRHLFLQILVAMLLGAAVGGRWPEAGVNLKILADGFIKLIRMMVAPVIFTSVVVGIAGMGNLKRVGRIGAKALLYFEVMTTVAMVIGIVMVKAMHPGTGVNADATKLNAKDIESYVTKAHDQTVAGFFLNLIPKTMVGAFAEGEIIQVLFISVCFGLALASLGSANRPLIAGLDLVYHALMRMIAWIIRLAPLAAFGAMAFTFGKFGLKSLLSLGELVACMYLSCAVFIVVCLGVVLWWNGISLIRYLRHIREEILIGLGTASSEPVFPRLMAKLEGLGCSRPVVGLVLPAGYSFNLDGSSLYLTLGALYIAQATNTALSTGQELTMLLVCLVTSKGAAAVVGGGFITLAATLATLHTIPVEGMVLIIGIDQFLASARATTNLIGNGAATLLIAKWEGELDPQKAAPVLR